MKWTIPGTVIRAEREEAVHIEEQFSSMFLAGGIVLSQVSAITGLETYTIQNWVKRGFLTAPQKKKYTIDQLCRIININMLKGVLQMEHICSLLSYINGQLNDSSDDTIGDAQLYFMFVRLAAGAKELYEAEDFDTLLEQAMADYVEPVPGAKARIKQVLRIMLTAWLAARMQQAAHQMLSDCGCIQSVKEMS